jgi:hypothetical protein
MRGSVTGSDTLFILERDLRGTFLNAGAAEGPALNYRAAFPPLPLKRQVRSPSRARVSPGRSIRFWAGGEQLPVSLGDDFDAAVDHSYRGLVVDRVRRHR